ncbi:LYR motif containing protein 1 isoform X1 [Erpetoichthys calabaricus]|uniref:LYR motif containing protein 1 isoform X1 n=1 Tax=Erpetoichthys calabaricus TaxID=27687 RepID=UPI002234DFE0|nr:LYR motif containing protein 1 isoform X1 [Erpetoichthys calabaricus]XP_051789771.1 LYR motif containing protein 1 isoform X1 [Erpetoichthys calabaricus]
MSGATRQEVLGLYRKVLRIARRWQSQSGLDKDSDVEKKYICQEARNLFKQNRNITDPQLIKNCIEECNARIEIGLHYKIPYPRPTHLPPMGLATQSGRRLHRQVELRKQAKPIYLHSHHESG